MLLHNSFMNSNILSLFLHILHIRHCLGSRVWGTSLLHCCLGHCDQFFTFGLPVPFSCPSWSEYSLNVFCTFVVCQVNQYHWLNWGGLLHWTFILGIEDHIFFYFLLNLERLKIYRWIRFSRVQSCCKKIGNEWLSLT